MPMHPGFRRQGQRRRSCLRSEQWRPFARLHRRMRHDSSELKRFLFANLYRHPAVMATTERARAVVQALFAIYLDRPSEMSEDYQAAADRPRAVADYIAGMTDRFALKEHQRLTGEALFGNSWASLGSTPA